MSTVRKINRVMTERGHFPLKMMAQTLLAAGWTHPTIMRWDSPNGKSYLGLQDAWSAYSASKPVGMPVTQKRATQPAPGAEGRK